MKQITLLLANDGSWTNLKKRRDEVEEAEDRDDLYNFFFFKTS